MKKTPCNGTIPASVVVLGEIEMQKHKFKIKKTKRQKLHSPCLVKESPKLKVLITHKLSLTWKAI